MNPIGSEDYVELRNSGSTLAISSKRSVDLFNAGAAEPAANRSVVLDFQVENVDEERFRLCEKVSEFVLEPTDQPWGNRSMLFRDPDGNLINFFTPIRQASCESARSGARHRDEFTSTPAWESQSCFFKGTRPPLQERLPVFSPCPIGVQMTGTRSRTRHSNVRGRRSFRGCRVDSSSRQLGKFSLQRRGAQGRIGNPRKSGISRASSKTLASEPLIKEIFIEAPPPVVFQLLTDPTKIIRWLGIRAEIDPKCGGTYRLHLDGREVILGEYLEFVADTRLVFTWGSEQPCYSIPAGSTTVEIDLEPDGKGTRARLSHRQVLPLSPSRKPRLWQVRPEMLECAGKDVT